MFSFEFQKLKTSRSTCTLEAGDLYVARPIYGTCPSPPASAHAELSLDMPELSASSYTSIGEIRNTHERLFSHLATSSYSPSAARLKASFARPIPLSKRREQLSALHRSVTPLVD